MGVFLAFLVSCCPSDYAADEHEYAQENEYAWEEYAFVFVFG